MLGTAERISTSVESHNSEIQHSADRVNSLQFSGEMEVVRMALLGHMSSLLLTNRRLQDDLLCTRYQLEEQAQEIDDVRREARTDELTKVANRKAIFEKLHLLMDFWRRERRPFTLVLIDLDQFKWINDAHGHQAGDRVLGCVGEWLKTWIREGDVVGRYGGDEFVVLMPFTDAKVGHELAETIRTKTADQAYRINVRNGQVSVSLSIGVACPREGDTVETLLQRADEALFKAKRHGRNQVQDESLEATPEPEMVAV